VPVAHRRKEYLPVTDDRTIVNAVVNHIRLAVDGNWQHAESAQFPGIKHCQLRTGRDDGHPSIS